MIAERKRGWLMILAATVASGAALAWLWLAPSVAFVLSWLPEPRKPTCYPGKAVISSRKARVAHPRRTPPI